MGYKAKIGGSWAEISQDWSRLVKNEASEVKNHPPNQMLMSNLKNRGIGSISSPTLAPECFSFLRDFRLLKTPTILKRLLNGKAKRIRTNDLKSRFVQQR